MERSFLKTTSEVLQHFGVTEKGGLSDDQVTKSRSQYGRNGQ